METIDGDVGFGAGLATGPDVHGRIAQLEAEIETLTASLERCRKIAILAKLVLAAAALWLGSGLFGFVRLDAVTLLGPIAAMIGGIVLLGSNDSTRQQMEGRIAAAEAERAALIGSIGLRVVGGGRGGGGGYLN